MGKSNKVETQQRQGKGERGGGGEGRGGGEIVSFFLGTGLNPSWSSVAAFLLFFSPTRYFPNEAHLHNER